MFERPLIYLVPAAAAALYCAVCLEYTISLTAALLLLALFLFAAGAAVYHKRLCTVFCMLAAASFALVGLNVYHAVVVEPIRTLASRHAEITATVLEDAAVYDDSQRAKLVVDDNDVLPGSFRMFCYLPLTEQPLHAGDRIKANVGFYLPKQIDGFDRAAYQAADRCFIAASYTEDDNDQPVSFSVLQQNNRALRWMPQRIARFCREAVNTHLPSRQAGLLNGLLLGDKSGLSDADALALRIAGLSHLVAVSGLHIGFLVGFCFLLFGRKLGTYLSIPLIVLFVPIAGATPSVLRAAIMYLIAAGAFVLKKESGSLNSLFFALGLLLILNPYSIASLSLQLSFAATLGLILLSGRMQRKLTKPFANAPKLVRRMGSVVAGALSCTVSATICTTPILLSSFGYVSMLSLLSNLLVVGVTAVCFIGGFLLCIISGLLPAAAAVLSTLLQPFLNYILWIAERISDIPFGLISWGDSYGVAVLVILFAVVLLWLVAGRQIRWRWILPCVGLLTVGLSAAGVYDRSQHYTVTYLPCGARQAVIVADSKQHMTLIDCAGDGGYRDAASLIQEWMQWNNFTQIDRLILTAVDKGHARSLPVLLQNIPVNEVVIPAGCRETKHNTALLAAARQNGAKEIAAAQAFENNGVSIIVFPVTDGKLGVQIGREVLILHSPTQKQLAAFWASVPVPPQASEVVLSQRNLEDAALLQQTLAQTNAKRILLQAGSDDIAIEYNGIPAESPFLTGEIERRFKKE